MSLEIAWRLFWRQRKRPFSGSEKSPFSAEKAISFKFGKIASSGRRDARNYVTVVLAPWKSVPFQVQIFTFSTEKAISSGSEKLFFQVAKTRNLHLSDSEKSLFQQKKAISFRLGKFAFSGSQHARNSVKVVLAPSKSVPFQVRKNRLFRWKSGFFQVRKNRFHRSPSRSKLRQSCSTAPFQIRIIRLFSWYSDFFQVWKNHFFKFPRCSKLRQGCSDALKRRPLSDLKNRLFSWKRLFLSGSEKSLFQVAMLIEIAKRLWRPDKVSLFRFGKIAFSAEKAISIKFGKIASSGCQDARNCVRVVLSPWKPCFFRLGKIALS